jgi:tetratricopeptide (TPR) repeat protein
MQRRLSRAAAAAALVYAAAAFAPAAYADNGTENYYTPPKLKHQGSSVSPIAGAGTVVVKVLVLKDGSFQVQGVVRSTNHGDDAAALEIARSSTYRPAVKGKSALTAFYDYSLKFSAGGAESSDAGDAGGTAAYERMIRAGNYAGAKSGLTSYLTSHPTDAKAELDLGVANAYLGNPTEAAAAFDKAGTIPDGDKALAAKTYNDAATVAFRAKDYATAIAAAKHAVALAPGPFTYNSLGTAEDAAGQPAAAIADLEKARALAATDGAMKASDRSQIDQNLVSAYLGGGDVAKAKTAADEAKKLDPSEVASDGFIANYYSKSANAAESAGKFSDAASLFEQGAAAAPSQAVSLYAAAALAYLKDKPNPDNVKAKAAADKALAVDPDNALANFAAGVALANQPGKTKDALAFLNRADASSKKGSDPSLTAAIENIIKQVGGAK